MTTPAGNLATFAVDAQVGTGRIEVNGQDISRQVREVTVHAAVNEIPTVTVQLLAGAGKVEGVGIVQVVPAETAADIDAFLAGLDAEELERVALARLDLGNGPAALTAAMLRQLREWAGGG